MTAAQHHKLNDFPCFLVERCFKVQVLHTCRETESRSSGKEQFCNFSFSRHMTEFWTLLIIFMLITHHEQRRSFSSEIFFSKSLSFSHLERASLPRAFWCSSFLFKRCLLPFSGLKVTVHLKTARGADFTFYSSHPITANLEQQLISSSWCVLTTESRLHI